MRRPLLILNSIIVATGYILAIIYLDDVKILDKIVTPVINLWILLALVLMGVILGFILVKSSPSSIGFILADKTREPNGITSHKTIACLLIAVLISFKMLVFLLSPHFIQMMYVWPDSIGYLAELHTALEKPALLMDSKSPAYTLWLVLNHITLGRLIDPQLIETHFGSTVYLKDVWPPLILQNILGFFSALICFSIFIRIHTGMAFAVTLLVFLNPTTLAIENTILREPLALFFTLSGIALYLKAIRENKTVVIIMSGFVFVLAYQTRPELLTIYIILALVLFSYKLIQQQKWTMAVLFCLPLAISLGFTGDKMSATLNTSYGGKFVESLYGLKSACYFYASPNFPELINNIQRRAIQCERERHAPCEGPAVSIFTLKGYIDEEVARHNQTRSMGNLKPISLDQVFMDIVANSTTCYVKSVLANIGYNISHHLQNIAPILYGGNNHEFSKNFTYYASPKIFVLYEKNRNYYANKVYYKSIIFLFRAIELHLTRKILLPFFFIGTWMILKSLKKLFFISDDKFLVLLATILIAWIHLTIISIMVDPVARFVFPIFPFIFAVEAIGVIGVYRWIKEVFSDKIIPEKSKA